MKPTPATELLIQAAKLLYGERWSGTLGDALDVDPRTLQRFASGQYQMPDDHPMLRDLVTVMDRRLAELKRIRDRMDASQRKAYASKQRSRSAPVPTP